MTFNQQLLDIDDDFLGLADKFAIRDVLDNPVFKEDSILFAHYFDSATPNWAGLLTIL